MGRFLALLLSMLLIASCVPASAPRTLKVGLVAPFSGRDAALGYNMLVAVKLALKEWNDRGGAGGYYIELVAQDDHNQAEAGATQARKMALDPQLAGVVGHPSRDSALAAASIYREAGLAAVFTGAGLSGDEVGGPSVFQLGASERELSQEAARFIGAQGLKRLIVLYDGRPGLATHVADQESKAGQNVAAPIRFTRGDVSQQTPAMAASQAGVDLVFYEGDYVDAAAFLTAMKSGGTSAAFLGGPRMGYPDFLRLAGPLAEGAYYLSSGPNPAGLESARRFVDAYKAAAGTDPWPQSLQAYDAVNAMLESLDRGLKSGQKPREAVLQGLSGGNMHGLSGPLSFDGQGVQAGARGYIYRIEGLAWPGKLVNGN